MSQTFEDGVVRALRRINRMVDLQSRRLVNQLGLTGPQLVCVRALAQKGRTTPSVLAKDVSLSQATVTGVIDRLVARNLVKRDRSEDDRRQIFISLTADGEDLASQSPSPLHDRFLEALTGLNHEDRQRMLATLEQVADMMDGEGARVAPSGDTQPQAIEALEDLREQLGVDPEIVPWSESEDGSSTPKGSS